MELLTLTLPNGIRLVHKPLPSDVAHCGLFINAGSRDELQKEHGIAHFIEHCIFKGTEKRNLLQVLNRLENVGADLNAFTTKEETCIHASFLNVYYERTLELLSDICFHSVFPEKEIRKEKEVIIDEIRSYQDSPSEQIFDDFEDLLFEGHPLGRNILGTPGNVRKFDGAQIRKFIGRNYSPQRMVISSAGNIDEEKLFGWVRKYFDDVPTTHRNRSREPFSESQSRQITRKKKTFQTHCIIGATGYSLQDEKRFSLALLNNILGGPMMNSRLSLALRERNGIAYQIESGYMPYSDTGIVTIYFGTSREMLDKATDLVCKELRKVMQNKLGTIQLETAKKVIIGQLALARESQLTQMLAIGKSYLTTGRYMDFGEVTGIISRLTSEDILETANKVYAPDRLSTLIFQS